MSDNPKGKDGFARVIARMKQERRWVRYNMAPHWRRLRNLEDTHAGTNLFTEYERVPNAEYYRGHMLYLFAVLHGITLAMLLWRSV